MARIAVTNGVGIGYFIKTDVREDIAAGRLLRSLENWTPPLAPLCLYYLTGAIPRRPSMSLSHSRANSPPDGSHKAEQNHQVCSATSWVQGQTSLFGRGRSFLQAAKPSTLMPASH